MTETFKPQSESEIADAVRAANGSFEIIGHGTKRGFGRHAETTAVLDTSALTGIVKYEPEELVVTVRAATPIAEIEAALAEKNQMLGFEPADWGPLFGAPANYGTIAGTASSNVCGSRRIKAGAVRDHVIGCRFVNGKGEAIKAGGPVIKNVTGFDVPRLLCGAFGTLGVLTELTLRVTPKPERVAAVMFRCTPAEGLRCLREAAQSPLDPTGLAYISYPKGTTKGEGCVIIRVEGAPEPAKDKLEALKTQFAAHLATVPEDDGAAWLFGDIGSGGAYLRDGGDGVWRLCVPPAAAHEAVIATGVEAGRWYADWAGGLLWLGLPATAEVAAALRAMTKKFGGHATLMRASAEARAALDVFEPEAPAHAALTRSVKAAFDPRRIFNPGRMYKDL